MSKEFHSFEDLAIKSDLKTRYYNHIGIPTDGVWYANPVMQTQDRICEKHDLYTDKLMKFPTNHISWIGCRKCVKERDQKLLIASIRDDMASRGMIWDNRQKKFISTEPERQESTNKSITKSWQK